uniref:Uncharacterized protein n=1 Tax=Timema shepardi TaxID=629360 RepID=A0A7R9AMA1_TIMSH|nr:unnamed protein product [Timema shepardi]
MNLAFRPRVHLYRLQGCSPAGMMSESKGRVTIQMVVVLILPTSLRAEAEARNARSGDVRDVTRTSSLRAGTRQLLSLGPGQWKRKDVGEEYLLGAPLGSRTGTPVVRLQDMPPSEGGGGEDGNWARTYYEQHPISAAANAMLNIGGPGGGNPEEQAQNMGGLIYEYYKFSGLSVGDKDKIEIWP